VGSRISRLTLVTALAAGLLGAGAARGQIGYTMSSLDLLVAEADDVVRGVVVDVTRGPAKDYIVTGVVTLDVRETLKGPEAKRLRFVAQTHEANRMFEQWRDVKAELLWFFDRKKPGAGASDIDPPLAEQLTRHGTDLHLAGLGWAWSKVALGPRLPDDRTPPPPIFTTEMRLLDKPEDILKAARDAVAEGRGRGPVRRHAIDLPSSVAGRTGYQGDANRFYVPVDRHLEALARRLIAAPGAFVPKAEELSYRPKTEEERRQLEASLRFSRNLLRAEGAKALKYFKSEENVATLKPLLTDDADRVEHAPDGREVGRVYYVRKAAYETLWQWGVDVPRPVLRVDLPGK
jgi:hypothetical protein